MDILGVGLPEVIVVFILALMVLGPRRLPALAGRFGRQLREWRMMSQVFLVEWREELAALEEARQSFEEAKQALVEARQLVTSEIGQVQTTVAAEMTGAEQDISKELTLAEAAVGAVGLQVKNAAAAAIKSDTPPPADQTPPTTEAADKADAAPAETQATSAAPAPAAVTELESDVESDVVPLSAADLETTPNLALTKMPASHPESGVSPLTLETQRRLAAEVATEVAKKVAAEVSTSVAKKVAAEVAEEVANVVLAKMAQVEAMPQVG